MIGKLQNLKAFTKYECLVVRARDGSTLRAILLTDAEGNLEPLPRDLYSEVVALHEIPEKDNTHKHEPLYGVIRSNPHDHRKMALVDYCTCGMIRISGQEGWQNPPKEKDEWALVQEENKELANFKGKTTSEDLVITDPEEVIRCAYGAAMGYFREFFDNLGASRYPDSRMCPIRFTTGSLFAIEELMKTFGKRFVIEFAFKHRQDIEAAKRLRNTVNVKED